ncbi:FMN-binding protein [Modestobacter muralis]|uniref:FMN-binding protein n=1 Tax=Modestobacter muralis TaxID=1608614 RepID=A0A6P0EUP6_9ACTN|nr:FMN-binding protein [Modestobacter muralis]NEN52240.1 FMN-binding protein [Modestobacter muralis]
MKKIVLWFMSTVTVVVLLFGYHTSTSSTAVASAQSSAVAPVTSGAGTSSGSSSGSSTSGTSTSTTFTGDSASTRWGPVQVEITVAGGTVTDVSVVDYPDGNGKDRQINARALPVLVQETLDAQSADIDMVSGATVTSDGYVESLQSALDQAGL